jgi:hypothetical protein
LLMEKRKKSWALAFLGAALVLLILLSASLPHLAIQPGRPFSLGEQQGALPGGGGPQGGGEVVLLVLRAIMALAAAALPFYIIIHLLTPEGRRRLVGDLFLLLAVLLLLNLVPENVAAPPAQEAQPATLGQPPLPPASDQPPDEFVADVPPWVDVVAIAALAVLVSAALAGLLWWVMKRRKSAARSPLEKLAEQAQESIAALHAGADIKDTVIRSYVQMSYVLEQERGMYRERAMTPHEFEQLLSARGVPAEPVQALTRLFAQVRYGNQVADAAEKQVAIQSLQAIVTYCKGAEAAP